jgi:hypothetical protein
MHQACEEFLTLDEQSLIALAKISAPKRFEELLQPRVLGKSLPLPIFAKEALRCAKLALNREKPS